MNCYRISFNAQDVTYSGALNRFHNNGLFQKKSTPPPPDGWGLFLTPRLTWIS